MGWVLGVMPTRYLTAPFLFWESTFEKHGVWEMSSGVYLMFVSAGVIGNRSGRLLALSPASTSWAS
jgi:hypothetical protein